MVANRFTFRLMCVACLDGSFSTPNCSKGLVQGVCVCVFQGKAQRVIVCTERLVTVRHQNVTLQHAAQVTRLGAHKDWLRARGAAT